MTAKDVVYVLVAAVIALGVLVAIFDAGHLQHWSAVHFGIKNGGPDPYYNFWSGIGSDLGELTLVVGVVTLIRHVNCHEHGCWRIARMTTKHGHKLCHRHAARPNSELTLPVHHDDHR